MTQLKNYLKMQISSNLNSNTKVNNNDVTKNYGTVTELKALSISLKALSSHFISRS